MTDLHLISVLGNLVFTWISSKHKAGKECHRRIKARPKKWYSVLDFT
jgi:hypothetical protein